MSIKIVEHNSVSPSHGGGGGGASVQTLPLLYFDMIFLQSRPTETLNFYGLKCSESYFLETIVLDLRHSLSITLKHFLPLAGKIVFPLGSNGMPVSRYGAQDSVALTIAISDADFANLTGNHPKPADEFHHFVPKLPQAEYSDSDDAIKFSVVAIQVTLFPNQGICFGFTRHHAICDLSSFLGFVAVWATTHKLNSDGNSVGNSLPSYDRCFVEDANKLTKFGWNQMKTSRPTVSLALNSLPSTKIRATFTLRDDEIKKLKNFATVTKLDTRRVSSFVVVCAHIWNCIAKSAAGAGVEVADDEPEYFAFPINCRALLNPPLPDSFFGNCVVFSWADSTHGRLKGSEGFVVAVEAIATAIRTIVENSRSVLDNIKKRLLKRDAEEIQKRAVFIAGSLKIDHYEADYGWGRAIKYECIHTDYDGAISLCKGRDGGVEIGVSMPKVEMDAFAATFNRELCIHSNL